MTWTDHLIIAPIIVPLLAGGLMLLLDGRSRTIAAAINVVSTGLLLAIAISLTAAVNAGDGAPMVKAYLLGNWPAEFGIVLVSDRLSSLMLLLTALLASAALVFSLASWHRAGSFFHPLFQFLLMGLNGAFLTGDLFNLFVFFEVLLAASYGLALHGSGHARVGASLHYIAINLAAAMMFLIGVSLIYGTIGTLNIAALPERIAALRWDDRVLFEIGAGILGVAFLVKAAMWPLGFWLPNLYASSAAPVAAVFAIMTKVGIYVILRLSALTESLDEGSVSYFFAEGWLFYGGLITILFAVVGLLSAQDMGRLAGFSVLVSTGTLLTVMGSGHAEATGGALYYLVSSTLAAAAFFLLIELVERGRETADDVLAVTLEVYGGEDDEEATEQDDEVGVAIPAIMAVLGSAFVVCALLLSGLPPLSGFVAKFAILSSLFGVGREAGAAAVSASSWMLLLALLVSGLATVIAMARAGIRAFWAAGDRELPHVRVVELVPIAGLLLLCVALTVQAGPAMRFMQATADDLATSQSYIETVRSAPRAGAADGGGVP